jgi:mono/diheme cytochrome c family protein
MILRFRKAAIAVVVFGLAAACFTSLTGRVSAQGRGASRPQVVPPSGPVWEVIRKNCSSCHGIDDYAYYALDRPGWLTLLDTKHKDSGTAMKPEDQSVLLDWLVSRFGPNTKPFPRTYVAPEITTFFSDPEAKRLLDRACATCHDLERVNSARNPEEKWRVLAVDMRERGAKLTDEELEQLVEWLGRVRGTNQDK